MSGILMLSVAYEPLRVVTIKRGIGLIMAGKAEIIEESDEPLRSEKTWQNMPSVIRLTHFVKIPYRSKVPLNRKALIARDRGKCVYCNKSGNSVDHIIPRSKGGKHEWTNVYLSCQPCNQKKADKTLEELGWEKPFEPFQPKTVVWFFIGYGHEKLVEQWQPYLESVS